MSSKKKRRRLRIHLPKIEQKDAPKKKKKKRQRYRLTRSGWIFVVSVAAIVLAILLIIFIPRSKENKALKSLGYDKATIKVIREKKLTDTLIEKQYYSDYLAQCINDGTLNMDYLPYYTVVRSSDGLDAKDFLLINRLMDKGYEEDQIQNLFKNLQYWEMTPLLIYDYQPIEQNYIDDCIAHEDVNSQDHFELSNDYYKEYSSSRAADSTRVDMLVNKTWYLSEDYVPENLTELSSWYAATGQQLSGAAAEAMQAWGDAGRAVGVTFYAASAYRDYASQESVYDNYVLGMGQEAADAASARPGFSEHQTGLTVDIAASNEDDVKEYKDTKAYKWTSTNSQNYGWILRYPEGKEAITGYEFESWHYRYVGVELAQAVYASGMTYDEFWSLYLKPWDNESCKPGQEILDASAWNKSSAENESGEASPSPSAAAAQ